MNDRPVYIICTANPDGQGWRYYADTCTLNADDVEAIFDRAATENWGEVAAWRNVVNWHEHRPRYYRRLQDTKPMIPSGRFDFLNRIAAEGDGWTA